MGTAMQSTDNWRFPVSGIIPKAEGYKTDVTIEFCKEVSKGLSFSMLWHMNIDIILRIQLKSKVILLKQVFYQLEEIYIAIKNDSGIKKGKVAKLMI